MSKRKRLGHVGLVAAAGASLAACSDVPTGTVHREVFGGNTVAEARAACFERYGNETLCEHMSAERADATQAAGGGTFHRPFYYYGPWYNSSGIIMPGGLYQPMPTRPSPAFVGVKSFDSITRAPVGIAPSHNAPRIAFSSSSGVRSGGFGATGAARGGGGVGGGGGS